MIIIILIEQGKGIDRMLLKLLYRTIIIYILDFALLKFMGKREI